MSPFELNNNDIMSDKDIKEKIQRTFYQLENGKKIRKIMDFLTENQKDFPEYNGWIWLQGKLIYKPEIIFIGYNSPQEFQKNNPFKIPFTGERPLAFFGENDAFFNEKRYKEERRGTQWYEFNEKENNEFTWQVIDILRLIVEGIHPEQTTCYKNTKIPFWGAYPTPDEGGPGFGEKITFINLYPIATTDINGFQKMTDYLVKANFFKAAQKNWECKKFFIEKVKKLVSVMEPKLIVCMGAETYRDFTYDSHKTRKDEDGIFYNKSHSNVIGFDRTRRGKNSWPRKAVAKKIIEWYKSNNMI